MENNRRRISSKLLYTKVFFFLWGLFFFINVITEPINLKSSITLLTVILLVISIIYYCQTRPIIEYDFTNKVLYIIDKKLGENEVPVTNIQKILFSALGLSNSYSYKIVFTDKDSNTRKVRLFPIFMHTDITKLIADVKSINPKVEIRNWSFGLDELFD
jgi:hypothetical protein